MNKKIIQIAAVFGMAAVIIGAFGAHILEPYLIKINRLGTFETAVRYHFYHTLALVFISVLSFHIQSKWLKWSALFFIAGIVIFSGSLYMLCLTNTPWLGAVTPIGGVSFIFGWFCIIPSIKKAA